MMHLPGFGAKRARRLYDELGIDSLEALRGAAERQELRGLRGFGAKAEEKLLETLAAGADGRPRRASCSPVRCRSPSRWSARCGRTRCGPRRGGRLAAPAAPTRSRTST